MNKELQSWLEELGSYQYRMPGERSLTYRELLEYFPDNIKYLREYCKAAYLAGYYSEMERLLTAYSQENTDQFSSVKNYWLGNINWLRGNKEKAVKYWEKAESYQEWFPEKESLARKVNMAGCLWQKIDRGQLVFYLHPQVAYRKVSSLIEELEEARERFSTVIEKPFSRLSSIYIYPDENTCREMLGTSYDGFVDNELAELHSSAGEELYEYLLFTVDGVWPNYHPHLYAGLCNWARTKEAVLKSNLKSVNKIYSFPEVFLLSVEREGVKLQMAGFLQYLIERFNWQKVILWMRSPELIQSFKRVFSFNWKEVERGYCLWSGCSLDRIESLSVEEGSLLEEVTQLTTKFWQNVKIKNWSQAARYLSNPALQNKLALELAADEDYLQKESFRPVANCRPVPGSIIQHYVFGCEDDPWGVCRLELERVEGRLKISGWQCLAVRCKAWARRIAAGFSLNRPWPGSEFKEFVLELAKQRGIIKPVICELGIGTGRIADPFVKDGISYIGLDYDHKMSDEYLSKLHPVPVNLQVIHCDANYRIPLPDNSVDIILEVKVYLTNNIMKEFARILKPGGFILARVKDDFIKRVDEPQAYQKLGEYRWSYLPFKYNAPYGYLGMDYWKDIKEFSRPRPQAGNSIKQKINKKNTALPRADMVWSAPENPIITFSYRRNIYNWISESLLKRTVYYPNAPEPWYTEKLKLVKEEAGRLGISQDDKITYQKYIEGSLWEGKNVKRWLEEVEG